MAELTERFGFSMVGGEAGGSFGDDGSKYSTTDRALMDSLLSQLERHDHHYRPLKTSTAPAAPVVSLLPGGGQLEAGQTFHYSYATLDERGIEGALSDEATVVLPELLEVPDAPELDMPEDLPVTAGTLAPGNYVYGLTALRGQEESPLGPELPVYLDAVQGVRLAMPATVDADSFRVWRMGPGEPGFTRLAVVSSTQTHFVDDGSVPADPCACDPGNTPPDANTGASDYGVLVTLPAGAAGPWRLYRTTTSGIYEGTALVEEVVTLVDEFDSDAGVVDAFVDEGDPMQVGQPVAPGARLRVAPFALDGGLDLPAPAGYPERYPFLADGRLYVVVDGAWQLVGAGGGGESTGGGQTIWTSPNGTRWVQTVDNAGAIVMIQTALPGPPAAPTVEVQP